MGLMKFRGVLPAITTPFTGDGEIDHALVKKHVAWLVDNGAKAIIPLGSLGEGNTLRLAEKKELIASCLEGVSGRVPVAPGIGAMSTGEAVGLAKAAKSAGCKGLMVLPAYVHNGKAHESTAHFEAVFEATDLACMLYNNPIAYGTDMRTPAIAALAERHDNLVAVKESGGDPRRVTAIKAALGDRLDVLAGLDDMVVEAVAGGATGWVAGLVNAFPKESVDLFEQARKSPANSLALYRWFLPLLRLDTVPEFVQLIKLVQVEVGWGTERVRPPRLPLPEADRAAALELIREALQNRPG